MASEMIQDDRTTIGVSVEGEQSLALLMSRGWFEKEVTAFRLAIAYALAHGIAPTVGGTYTTKWNRGSLDQGDLLVELIGQFHETQRPYDLAQALGDAGLNAMAKRLRAGDSLTDIMAG